MTPAQRLADLLPALLCGAVEDVTGQPCRRVGCDGSHSPTGVDPWAPVAANQPTAPVGRAASGDTTTPEETR